MTLSRKWSGLGLLLLFLVVAWPPIMAICSPSGLNPAPPLGWSALRPLLRSLELAGIATLVAFILGLSGAYALSFRNLFGRSLLKALLLLPFLIPPYFQVIAWMRIFNLSGNLIATSTLLGFCFFPLVLYPTLAALERLSGSMEEAALLTLGRARTWSKVILPLVLPFSLVGGTLVWILALVEFGVPSLVGVNVYSQNVFALIQGYHDFAGAGMACLPLLVAGLLPTVIVFRWGSPRFARLTQPQTGNPAARLSRSPVLTTLLPFGIVVTTLAIPMIALLSGAHRTVTYQLALWEAGGDLLSSLYLSGLATLFALLMGALVGISGGRSWALAFLLTLSVPPMLSGLGLIAGINSLGLSSTNLLLVWGLAARYLGLSACLLSLSFHATPTSQIEAAKLNPHRFQALTTIVWGLHKRAWGASLVLTFALAMGDLSLNLMLCSPGTSTLCVRIFNLYHYGRQDLVSALCLLYVFVVLTPYLVVQCLESRE